MKTQIRHSDKDKTSEKNFAAQVAVEIKRRFGGDDLQQNGEAIRHPKSGKGI